MWNGMASLMQPFLYGERLMSNMSYCRFQNTLSDLKDCYDHIDDSSDLSVEEARARRQLIKICRQIAAEYEDSTDPDYR